MPTSSHLPVALAELSPLAAAYVEATNSFDLEGLLATFADRYWGKRLLENGQSATSSVKA